MHVLAHADAHVLFDGQGKSTAGPQFVATRKAAVHHSPVGNAAAIGDDVVVSGTHVQLHGETPAVLHRPAHDDQGQERPTQTRRNGILRPEPQQQDNRQQLKTENLAGLGNDADDKVEGTEL